MTTRPPRLAKTAPSAVRPRATIVVSNVASAKPASMRRTAPNATKNLPMHIRMSASCKP